MRKSLASWLEKYNTTNDFCGMTGFNYILLRKKYILKKSWLMSTGYSRAFHSTSNPKHQTPVPQILYYKFEILHKNLKSSEILQCHRGELLIH